MGAMHVRCGGCSRAMNHCAMANHEFPARATRPEHHGCAAICSMKSWPSCPSGVPQKQRSPSESPDPRLSTLMMA